MNSRPHLSRKMRRETASLKRKFQRSFANGGMPDFLDKMFGPGKWSYDEREKLWVVPDTKYRGPGRQYYCINIKGDWFTAKMPDEVAQ